MNFKEFHINGKYALSVALVAGLATLGASAIQVYKPFVSKKEHKKLYLTKNKNNLYTANYVLDDGVDINIFEDYKKADFSINPSGTKVVYLEYSTRGEGGLVRDTLRIINHDTSYASEMKFSSYLKDYDGKFQLGYCQVSVKGWKQVNSLILNISDCSDSVGFSMTGYTVTEYPSIKMTNGLFYFREDGDYVISFDEINSVDGVLLLK